MYTKISKIIIIKGDKVHNVGYRPLLFAKALRLRISNFDARNEEEKDGEKQSVVVCISGLEKQISDFVAYVKSEKGRPKDAKVDSITEESEYLENVISIEEYGKILNVEQTNNVIQGGQKIDKDLNIGFRKLEEKMDTGFMKLGEKMDTGFMKLGEKMDTGFMKLGEKMDTGFTRLGEKVDVLRTETNENFKHMDIKYDEISKGMFAIVDIIEKRNQIFEKRLEKTEKNIEKLLEILIDKKT
jgi:acylphosphatase